jgi:hypothetical protein
MTLKFRTNHSPMMEQAYLNRSIVCAKFSLGDIIRINGVPHKVTTIEGSEYGLEVCNGQGLAIPVERVTKKRGRPRKVLPLNSKNAIA